MSSYTENKGQLVINLMDLSIFQELASGSKVNLGELYLVQGEDTDEVVEVKYLADSQKFVYTTVNGNQVDIVTLAGLKNLFSLAAVASSGNYGDLTGKPSINGVTLTGDKSTSDLNIAIDYTTDSLTNKPKINGVTLTGNISSSLLGLSYNDLADKPAIPAVSSTYVPGNTGAALTSKGVEGALENYTPNSRTITGTGALAGGGDLTANRTITHNSAPSGIETKAIKVGVDSYGHVCAGTAITPADIAAVPQKSSAASSMASLDGSNTTIIVTGAQSETLGFSTALTPGKVLSVFYVNSSSSPVDITIPVNLADNIFVNEAKISANTNVNVAAGASKRFDFSIFLAGSTTYGFVNVL